MESGQERPHPKVRVPEKKGDRVGVWEKSTPHRGSLRWERFLCSRNSQGASVQDGNEQRSESGNIRAPEAIARALAFPLNKMGTTGGI